MNQLLTITFGSDTHRGLIRTDNQDYCGKYPEDSLKLFSPTGQLFLVADGMGGHMGGREASHMAVSIIQQVYFSNLSGDIPKSLHKAFETANEKIYQVATSNPNLHRMGTTCTVLALKDDKAFIAHVGDSRAYLINRNKIEQLTQDHSHVAEMRRQGILTEEEAKVHPDRSILTRALGVDSTVEVDAINNIPLIAGEYFLLCSDGLAKVDNKEIKSIILSKTPQQACERLVHLANERGGEDNVTTQVIRINGKLLQLKEKLLKIIGKY
ncbi:MAG: Stp1/IreP family PP2C-type Ser/Thr phosphatase [bacterium]